VRETRGSSGVSFVCTFHEKLPQRSAERAEDFRHLAHR
jgi:hypothetical protein